MTLRLSALLLSGALVAGCDADEATPDPETSCEETEPVDASVYFADSDGDGFGDPASALAATEDPGEGYVSNGEDCDDQDAGTYPGAEELCDSIDNDCDGEADTGETATFYIDADGDGFGAADYTADACEQPDGYTDNADDCNDKDGTVYPGAAEICDWQANDCDRDDWTPGTEHQTATFVGADGGVIDLSGMDGDVSIDAPGALNLCAGTWNASITVAADDVSIVGAGPSETVLSGGGEAGLIQSEGRQGLWISGLHLTDGGGIFCPSSSTYTCGGAIGLLSTSAALHNVTVTGSAADSGGAMGVFDGSDVRLYAVDFSGNNSVFNGGAIYAGADVNLYIEDSTLSDNATTTGGAIAMTESVSLELVRTLVAGNTATFFGGGLSADASSALSITDSVLTGNAATNIYCTEESNNCYGGAIYLAASTATLSNTEISDNHADFDGGGIYLLESSEASGTAVVFSGNTPNDIYDEATGAVSASTNGDFAIK